MKATSGFPARRAGAALAAAFAVGAGAVLVTGPAAPTGQAAPDPCAASEVAKTAGSVATSTGAYLETHPQTNQALTLITQQQSGPQSLGALKSYFDANPLVAADLRRLQQPLTALAGRCQLPVSLPQILGLVQAAQTPAQIPAQPASPPAAQSVGVGTAEAATAPPLR
ncbi:hemophore [Mycolicibacterium rufum]|uniref:Hemophore n=1 Tax=Mycolicibacterium rufum TaxID=318424 RepID=A0ABY3UEY7_9MYCO|nr:hemophore [Mycolicibacterium rufum]ULP37062.1 hemophore [Mycolicibacterium rufum]